jgi:hypothetical protein
MRSVKLFTTNQVAEQLSISIRRVQALAKSRKLGYKYGRDILFTSAEITQMKDRKVGRPPIK